MANRKEDGAEARWEKNHDELQGKKHQKAESRWEEVKEEGITDPKKKQKKTESRWESEQNK